MLAKLKLSFFLMLTCVLGSLNAADTRPIKGLFLGDNGHHVPATRFKELEPVMKERGIVLTYTDKLEDLNSANLAQYDVLMIYANHTVISPAQEKALLDFVNGGKGLVPLHCASACFGNSPAYIALVGGRFKTHKTGVFKDTLVQPAHPAIAGLKPIETWDETYVHDQLAKDSTILATRVDDKGAEPWTWVRQQGQGRVFYTAWGHDERTWLNPGFQDLVEHGIRWAAFGSNAPEPELKKKEGLKPFTMVEAAGPIPIYKPDPKWGVQGKAANMMQAALTPDESKQHLVALPGFDVQLWASEPDIVKPVCFNWDERGRLWIAETFDYPNDLQPSGMGHDRIKICEDTTGSGKADKFTVFADKLSVPTSITFSNGGVIVAQAPDQLFLKDSTGGDHADVRKTLFTGWGTGDTHSGPSNQRWGFDNHIWGMVGYSGFSGESNGKHLNMRMGFYRYKPDGSALEYIRASNNNTWGFGLSEDNIIFGSTANNNASMYMPIANRYYEAVQGFSAGVLGTIATSQRYYPITDRYRQVDCFGCYTAGTGHMLYTARAFPKEYWNSIAFVAEPTGHLVGKFKMVPEGADFIGVNSKSFIASDDEWSAPITAEVGPDGALWVIDWYNFIVQHNPTPQGFKTGRRGAYETPLRDKTHGRIYRIVAKDAKPYTPINLANAAPEKLVETLKNDNLFWRMQAQRLLVERNKQDVLPALLALVKDTTLDEIGLNPASIHALWTLQGIGALDGKNAEANAAAIGALKHPSAGTRRAAAMTMPRDEAGAKALLDSNILEDADAQVRLATLLTLSEMPASDAAGAVIFKALNETRNNTDKWIPHALICAAAKHDASFLRAALSGIKVDPSIKIETRPKSGSGANLVQNAGFENERNGKPDHWKEGRHGGKGEYALAASGHSGGRSVQLSSATGADIGWNQEFEVHTDTNYKLSGWIKTENVKGAKGALFNIHELQQADNSTTKALQGTNDWTHVETVFNSGPHKKVGINCLFGGWGLATGTAWYDDVELVQQGGAKAPPLPGEVGKVLQLVTNNYARRGPADTIVQTLLALKEADSNLALPVLDGVASGWPAGKAPDLKEGDAANLSALMKALPEGARGSLLALAERWGKKDLFAGDAAEISKQISATLADSAAAVEARSDAARRLLILADNAENVQTILSQITPQTSPDLARGLIGALGESRLPETGGAILSSWKKFTPAARTVAIVTLTHRTEWTAALLGAIEKKELLSSDVATEIWAQLKNNPEKEISALARKLEKSGGGGSNPDLKALVKKLTPLTLEKGDPAIGKAFFEKTCMVCHTINGKGGQVGPNLTGFGAHPKAEILLAVADPNASVEANYRLWMLKTADGLVLQGRLESESQTSVELLDTTGAKHVVERKDIKILRTDNQSIMPEGLTDKMTPDELKGLLEFISESKVK